MSKFFYISLPEDKIDLVQFAFCVLVAYALYTWFSLQVQVNITADTLWLADAAGRLLRGEAMSQSYYDPNPPLSVILYTPAVLAAGTGLVSLHNALFAYVLLLIAGAAAVTYRILRVIPGTDITTAMTGMTALIMAGTVMAAGSYTERDQIIGIWLVPFVLAQLALTKGWPVPGPTRHAAFLIGTILILVKPHHGLLPTLLIIHRALAQRRFSVWKDADFLYLAAGVAGYAGLLAFYFPDFLQVMLPDILQLYVGGNFKPIMFRTLYYALVCLTVVLFSIMAGKTSWLPYLFLGAALISLIPYAVQMRGYHYHLMPAVIFFWCGTALFGKELFQRYMSPHLALVFVTGVMTIFAFYYTQARLSFPTTAQYQTLPMAKALADCEAPCPFFVINDHIEITHQTALYTGREWASRFPSLWFLPGIYKLQEKDPAAFTRLQNKYVTMIAEDLERYKPRYVLAGSFKLRDDFMFELLPFTAGNAAFRAAWAAYTPAGEVTINQAVYFPHNKRFRDRKITYKIFRRTP